MGIYANNPTAEVILSTSLTSPRRAFSYSSPLEDLLKRLRLLDGIWMNPDNTTMAGNVGMYIITLVCGDQITSGNRELLLSILYRNSYEISELDRVRVQFDSSNVLNVLQYMPRAARALVEKVAPPSTQVDMTFKEAIIWVINFVKRLLSPVSEDVLSPATA